MKKIYRVVFNRTLGTYVVASELAKGSQKSSSGIAGAALMSVAALLGTSAGYTQGLPTGGQTVSGAASIQSNGSLMTVAQTSSKAIINWHDFSIGAGNKVQFVQPSASAVALNRVLGANPSQIQGSLSANGQVFLLNPNGVLFSATSQVSVGGLLASTLAMSNADFLAGRYVLKGNSAQSVVNQGQLQADPGGFVALVAAKVENTGQITAKQGSALLGAGSEVTLDLGGPVKLRVDAAALDAQISNGGAIQADGGTVLLTARASADLHGSVINQTGSIRAQTLATGEKGEIYLLGDLSNNAIDVGGTLDATAPHGGAGGFIETSAALVSTREALVVKAGAQAGQPGGTWLIDPADVTIGTGGNSGYADSSGTYTPNSSAAAVVVNVTTLTNALNAGTSVNVTTVNTGTAGLGNGDITVSSAITKSAGGDATLTLQAHRNITVNADITSTAGKLNLTLSAANNAGSDLGGVQIADGVSLKSNGGNILLGGGGGSKTTSQTNGIGFALNYSNTLPAISIGNLSKILSAGGNITLNGYSSKAAAGNSNTTGIYVQARAVIDSGRYTNPADTSAASGGDINLTGQYVGGAGGNSNKVFGITIDQGNGNNNQQTTISASKTTGSIYVFGSSTYDSLGEYALNMTTNGLAGNIFFNAYSVANLLFYLNGSLKGVTFTYAPPTSGCRDGFPNCGLLLINSSANNSYLYATYNAVNMSTKPIYVSATATGTKEYNGTTAATGLNFSNISILDPLNSGYVNGNVTSASYQVSGSNVGNYTALTYSNQNYSAGGNNYVLGFRFTVSPSYSITPATATILGTKTFDGNANFSAAQLTASGVNGQTLTISGGAASANSVNVADNSTNFFTSLGSLALTNGSSGTIGLASNYVLPSTAARSANNQATINPFGISVLGTSGQKFYDGTATFTAGQLALSGVTSGDSVTLAGNATVASANVATYTAWTTTALTLGGTSATNYTLTGGSVSAVIAPAPLTVTANNQSRAYGSANPSTGGVTLTSGTLVGGDTLSTATVAAAASATTSAAAGTSHALTPSAQTFTSGSASNYNITYANGSLSISAAPLTITASNANKTYGDAKTFAGTEFTSNGLQNGESIGSVTLASTGAVATAGVAGSPYTIVPSAATGGSFAAGNYSISYNNGSLTVDRAALSITAKNTSLTYGQSLPATTTNFDAVGLKNSETVGSVSQTSTATATSPAGTTTGITVSNATGGTFSAGNYTITYQPYSAGNAYQAGVFGGALSISAAPLTITASNASKTYGDTKAFAGTEFTSSGLQNGEGIGSVTLTSTGAAATANVAGSPYTIVPSAATGGSFAAGNYSISYANGSLTVDRAPLAITAKNTSLTYGQSLPATTTNFDAVGLKNSETVGSVAQTSTATATSPAGTTTGITVSNATGGTFNSGNYAITYLPYSAGNAYQAGVFGGALSITAAPLTITASNASKTYGDTKTFAGTEFTPTGLQNGETVGSVTLTSGGAAATAGVAGSPYTIVPAAATGGTFSAGNYSISYANGSLTVSPAALAITAKNTSLTYGQSLPATTTNFDAVGLKNSETVGSVAQTSTATATSPAGTTTGITVSNATGGTFSAGNYAITYLPYLAGNAYQAGVFGGALSISAAPLTITASNASKTYGDAKTFAGTEFTSSGLQNGEGIGSVTLASSGAAATANVAGSPYTIVPSAATGGSFAAGNYSISYTNGSLTVNRAALSITAKNASLTYGQTLPATTTNFDAVGLKNSETVGSVAQTSTATATSPAGTTTGITVSNATGGTFSAGNYTITYQPYSAGNAYQAGVFGGALSISAAPLTITASNTSKTYGDTKAFAGTEFTPTGLQNGETVGSVTLTSGGAAATAGVAGSPYTIVPAAATGGTFSAGNYSISYANGSLTVSPAALAISAKNVTLTYGQSLPATTTNFDAVGLKNSETVGSVSQTSTATVGSPTGISISNASGGTFTGGNYTITYLPYSAGNAYQAGVYGGALTINPAPLTITASNASKTYGDTKTFAGTEFTPTGLQNGETVGSVTLTSSGAVATAGVAGSPYNIVPTAATGGTFSAGNYNISYANGSLTVNRAPLTITGRNVTLTYGQSLPATTTNFDALGLKNSETVGSVAQTSTATATSAAGTNTGISISNASGGTFNSVNYAITYLPYSAGNAYQAGVFGGALSISAAPLTITASNASKTYGDAKAFAGTEFTPTGLQNGETVGSLTLTSGGAAATAGVAGSPYTIVPAAATGGTFSAGNYSISYANGSLTVSPAALAITAKNITKLAGVALPATTTDFVSQGLKNGETVGQVKQSGLGISSAAPVGSGYGIVISDASGGSFDPANYSISYTTYVAGGTGGSVTVSAPTVQFVPVPVIVQPIAPVVFAPSGLNYIPIQLPVAAAGAALAVAAVPAASGGASTASNAGPSLSAGGATAPSAGSTAPASGSGTTASAQQSTSTTDSSTGGSNTDSPDSSNRTANAVTAIGQVRDLVGPTNIRVVNGGINTSR